MKTAYPVHYANLQLKDFPAMLNFLERAECECCGSRNLSIVLEKKFVDPAVYGFIEEYYENKISKTFLGDHCFSVAACDQCGFLFQKYILDPHGMQFLYEKAVDQVRSLNKREKVGTLQTV